MDVIEKIAACGYNLIFLAYHNFFYANEKDRK